MAAQALALVFSWHRDGRQQAFPITGIGVHGHGIHGFHGPGESDTAANFSPQDLFVHRLCRKLSQHGPQNLRNPWEDDASFLWMKSSEVT